MSGFHVLKLHWNSVSTLLQHTEDWYCASFEAQHYPQVCFS